MRVMRIARGDHHCILLQAFEYLYDLCVKQFCYIFVTFYFSALEMVVDGYFRSQLCVMLVVLCVVLKLLKMARSVRTLLDTVMQALPEVGNLGLLFFLLFYIFAALGVELFGRIGE